MLGSDSTSFRCLPWICQLSKVPNRSAHRHARHFAWYREPLASTCQSTHNQNIARCLHLDASVSGALMQPSPPSLHKSMSVEASAPSVLSRELESNLPTAPVGLSNKQESVTCLKLPKIPGCLQKQKALTVSNGSVSDLTGDPLFVLLGGSLGGDSCSFRMGFPTLKSLRSHQHAKLRCPKIYDLHISKVSNNRPLKMWSFGSLRVLQEPLP